MTNKIRLSTTVYKRFCWLQAFIITAVSLVLAYSQSPTVMNWVPMLGNWQWLFFTTSVIWTGVLFLFSSLLFVRFRTPGKKSVKIDTLWFVTQKLHSWMWVIHSQRVRHLLLFVLCGSGCAWLIFLPLSIWPMIWLGVFLVSQWIGHFFGIGLPAPQAALEEEEEEILVRVSISPASVEI